jgi:hypothetical protein
MAHAPSVPEAAPVGWKPHQDVHPPLSLSSRAPKAVMGNKIPVKNQMTPGQQPGKSYPDTTELAGL